MSETPAAAIDVKAKDYGFVDDSCRVQLFPVSDDILRRLQTEYLDPAEEDGGDVELDEGMEGDGELGEGEEDGLDDGNDGFDDEGVIEIDDIDHKGANSAKKRNESSKSKPKGDKKKEQATQDSKSKAPASKKKKLLGMDDEDVKDEREMLSKID